MVPRVMLFTTVALLFTSISAVEHCQDAESSCGVGQELHDETSFIQVRKTSLIQVDELPASESVDEKTAEAAATQAAATQAATSTNQNAVQHRKHMKADPLPVDSIAEPAKDGDAVEAVNASLKYEALAKQKVADRKAALHSLQEKEQTDKQNVTAEKTAIAAKKAALNRAGDQEKTANAMEVVQEKEVDEMKIADEKLAGATKVAGQAAKAQAALEKDAAQKAKDAAKAAADQEIAVKKAAAAKAESTKSVGQRVAAEEKAAAPDDKVVPSSIDSAIKEEGGTRTSAKAAEAKASANTTEASDYQQLSHHGSCRDASNKEPSGWCKKKVASQVCKGACNADSQCSHYAFSPRAWCCLYGIGGLRDPGSGWSYSERAGRTQITKTSYPHDKAYRCYAKLQANEEATEAEADATDLSEESVTSTDEDVAAMEEELDQKMLAELDSNTAEAAKAAAIVKYLADMKANATTNGTWWGQSAFKKAKAKAMRWARKLSAKATAKAKNWKKKLTSIVKAKAKTWGNKLSEQAKAKAKTWKKKLTDKLTNKVNEGKQWGSAFAEKARAKAKNLLKEAQQKDVGWASNAYEKAQAAVVKAASNAQDLAKEITTKGQTALKKAEELKSVVEKNLAAAKKDIATKKASLEKTLVDVKKEGKKFAKEKLTMAGMMDADQVATAAAEVADTATAKEKALENMAAGKAKAAAWAAAQRARAVRKLADSKADSQKRQADTLEARKRAAAAHAKVAKFDSVPEEDETAEQQQASLQADLPEAADILLHSAGSS